MITNAFRATLADDTPVGLCFEPALALANHSCIPNAVVVFDGRSVALRASKVILKGEQVFISYITATEDRSSRQKDLKQRYFFSCQCEKCNKAESPRLLLPPKEGGRIDMLYWDAEDPLGPRAPEDESIINDLTEKFEYAVRSPDFSKANTYFQQIQLLDADPAAKRRVLKQAVNACASETKRYYVHPMPKILHELYLNYLEANSHLNALVMLLFLFLNCDVYNYQQSSHPVRVVRLFTISKLLKHLSSLSHEDLKSLAGEANTQPKLDQIIEEIDWITSFHAVLILVLEQVPKSHGKQSRFMAEVETEMREVEEVQKLRGDAGSHLREWMLNPESTEWRKVASDTFERLNKLSRCVWEIVAS